MIHGRQNARNPTPAIPGIGFGKGAKLPLGKERNYRFVSFTPETCDDTAFHAPSALMNTLLDQ